MNARELDALFAMTGGTFNPAGFREIHVAGKTYWVPVADRAGFERKLQAASILGGWLSLRPRIGRDRWYCDRSAVVWARCETGASMARLEMFEPRPTLILQDGESVKRTALWWLSVELNRAYLLKANERLAHAVGGVKAAAWPEGWIEPPGPGTRVQIASLTDALYHPNEVVGAERPGGKLIDPPRRRWPRRTPTNALEALAA